MFADDHRERSGLSDLLDPFVAAADYMVCDSCDEFIPLDENGFNCDHACLDPRRIREAYATLMDHFLVEWRPGQSAARRRQ